jgi:hypothetical protein
MQFHPTLTTAVLAERQRDLRRYAEQQRTVAGRNRRLRGAARRSGRPGSRVLSNLVPRLLPRTGATS